MKKVLAALALILIIAVVLWRKSPEHNQPIPQSADSTKTTSETKETTKPVVIKIDQKYSTATQTKLKVLEEVFNSKNDNDPRLDSEFEEITPELREALISTYKSMPRESLNERGTIVFLLGKEINSEKDLEFFQDIFQEAPCLSLADCSTESKLGNPEDDHLSESQETTLVYPQLMALRLVSAQFQKSKSDPFKEKIREVFRLATQSSSEYISQEAERIGSEAGITNVF